jgi:flagellar biosynthesis chaperone FliJ
LSDSRLKKNQKSIEDSLHKIKKMSAVSYEWKDDSKTGQKKDIGLIAQEVQPVFPEIVSQRKDGFLAIKYEKIIPILVEAIKQKQQKINKLKSVIDNYGNTN